MKPRAGFLQGFAPTLLGVSACSAVPAPATTPSEVPRIAAPAAAPLPARWIASGCATRLGPELGGGTMVLLGGRRALVRADGSLQVEHTPAPESLRELALVPSARGPRLAGRGAHGVYRFDDPLGAAVVLGRAEVELTQLGAGPGVVAVWTERSDGPALLDVETGREAGRTGWPELPLVALSFLDERRGAAVFGSVGLAVTTDGGASWRLPAGRGGLEVSGLRQRGGVVRGFSSATNHVPDLEGPDAAIDLERARLGAQEPAEGADRGPATLRWIRAGAGDPLETAAAGGIDLSRAGGGALVVAADKSLIGRVDVRTGGLADLLLLDGKWEPCSAARGGRVAWLACPTSDPAGADLPDPYGLVGIALDKGPFSAGRPVVLHNGPMSLRASPSGGAALLAPCHAQETRAAQGLACARQPEGRWETIALRHRFDVERGEGPLADGRVAFLRGIDEGDGARVRVVAVGMSGEEQEMLSLALPPSRGPVRVQSPIEEDEDRTLRFVLADATGPLVVTAKPGPSPAVPQRLRGATMARLRAGHGVAVGKDKLLASIDGGATWEDVAAPPAVMKAAGELATSSSPDALEVSELGFRLGPMVRLGWGPPAPTSAAPTLTGRLITGAMRPVRTLKCASAGPTRGTPPLAGFSQIQQLLAGAAKKPEKSRPRIWPPGRAFSLDAVLRFASEPQDDGAETWTLRWYDPQELGGKAHGASVKAPAGAAQTSLLTAAASGAHALFETISAGGQRRLIRVAPSGAVEIADTTEVLSPSEQVVFGGETIAWIHRQDPRTVVVWPRHQEPRVVAELAEHGGSLLGTPGRGGVPLLLTAADRSLLRVLPIPAAGEAPSTLGLDGWTRLPSLRDPLPICDARTSGQRFTATRQELRVNIDSTEEPAREAILDVRLAGSGPCLRAITVALAPAGKEEHARLVRADLSSRRAEAGASSAATTGHSLRCTLE